MDEYTTQNVPMIRRHPWGGYTIATGPALDGEMDPRVYAAIDPQYDTYEQARDKGEQEYGYCLVHPEVLVPAPDRSDDV